MGFDRCALLRGIEAEKARALNGGPLPAKPGRAPGALDPSLKEAVAPDLEGKFPGRVSGDITARWKAQREALLGRKLNPEEVAEVERAGKRFEGYQDAERMAKQADASGNWLDRFSKGKQATMGWWEKNIGGPLWEKIIIGKIWNKLPTWLRFALVTAPEDLPADARAIFDVGKAQERVIVEQAVELKKIVTGEGIDGKGARFTEEESRWIFWTAQGELVETPTADSVIGAARSRVTETEEKIAERLRAVQNKHGTADEVTEARHEAADARKDLAKAEAAYGAKGALSSERMDELRQAALAARDHLDRMGELVIAVIPESRRGLLSDATFFKNYGRYMPYFYKRFLGEDGKDLYQALLSKYVKSAPDIKMANKHFMARVPASPIMGYKLVEDPVAAARGFAEIGRDVVSYQVFDDLAKNTDLSSHLPKGDWQMIPDETKYGPLRGKYVEPAIHQHIKYMLDNRGEFGRIWDNAMGKVKRGMTMLNPGSWSKNLMGALVTNGQGTGRTLFDPRLAAGYLMRAKEYVKKEGYWREAMEANAIDRSYFGQSVREGMDEIREALMVGEQRGWSLHKTLDSVMGKIRSGYGSIDAINKLDIYTWARERGWTMEEAASHARKFGIDWERAGSAVRWMNRYPTPFITYSALALPRYIEASIKRPVLTNLHAVVFAGMSAYAAKQWGWDTDDEAKAKALMPDWMQGRSLVKLPLELGGEKGKMWDATYLMPWQSLAGVWGDASTEVKDLMFGNPLNAFVETAFNKNLHTGREIVRSSDPAAMRWNAYYTHIFRRFAPSLTPMLPKVAGVEILPGGYGASKVRSAIEGRPDYNGRVRTIAATFADVGMGLSHFTRDFDKERRRWIYEWRNRKNELKSSIARTRRDPTLRDDEKDEKIKAYDEELSKLQSQHIPEMPR